MKVNMYRVPPRSHEGALRLAKALAASERQKDMKELSKTLRECIKDTSKTLELITKWREDYAVQKLS